MLQLTCFKSTRAAIIIKDWARFDLWYVTWGRFILQLNLYIHPVKLGLQNGYIFLFMQHQPTFKMLHEMSGLA